jgi:hypothetical protein
MGGPVTVVDDFVKDVSNTLTQVTQPIEKAVTAGVEDTSKNLTSALQPVEKAVNYIGANPNMQLALAMAVAVPVVGEYIGAELMAAGVITSAETATVIGTAIASTSAQVAQGVPFEQAIQNTAADVAVQQLSPAAAKQLDGLLNSPAVTDAITSTVASGAATAARGGSQEEIEKAMTAGLAGSAASSAYKSVAQSAPDIYSKTIGGTTAGAVKGGTEGAVAGGLSSALGSLQRPSSTTNLAADTGGGADLEPFVDPSTSGGAAPAKLDPRLTPLEDGTGWRDKSGNIYSKNDFAVNADDGTLVAKVNVSGVGDSGKKEPVYLGELPEVTITGTREKEYTPEITLPSGYKIPRVDVYGSNQPSRTDFTPPPSLAEPEAPAEEAPAEEAPADKPSTYKPDIFVTTYKKPKSGSYSSTATLGAALGTTGTTTGLTAERGAGEIEGTGSGKPRKKVWNEESLKLKDALGV